MNEVGFGFETPEKFGVLFEAMADGKRNFSTQSEPELCG
jgi:hypothetical protein